MIAMKGFEELPDRTLKDIHERTGGWAAGLGKSYIRDYLPCPCHCYSGESEYHWLNGWTAG
jgi:hypothetical protein